MRGVARKITLRQRLIALVAVAVLPSAVALVYLIHTFQEGRTREVNSLALSYSNLAALEMAQVVGNAQAVLFAVGAAPVVRALAPACNAYLTEVIVTSGRLDGIAIADGAGRILCAAPPFAVGQDLGDADWFSLVPENGGSAVGTFSRTPDGRRYLPIATREPATGRLLVTGIDLDWLGERIRAPAITRGNSLVVADRNGTILAREPDPESFVGNLLSPQAMPFLRAAAPGTDEFLSRDGTRRIIGFQPPSGPNGLFVSAGLSTEATFSPIHTSTWRSLAFASVGTVGACILAAWLGDRLFRRPVHRILTTIGAWRAGDETARIGLTADASELSVLAAAIDDYMDSVAAARAARDAAEERRTLLLREMNHRIKNILAAVQAIANQTFKGRATPDSLKSFGARLRAMAASHDLLVQESWESTELVEALHAALDPFGTNRFRLEGPSLRIGANAALALGMALHELCTNAAKYGALSVPEGSIHLRWWLGPGADPAKGERFHLSWIETGGPPVAQPGHAGFGSQLIRAALSSEFDATATLSFDPGGCRFLLEADAARMLGPAVARRPTAA